MYLIYLEIGWSLFAPIICFFLMIPVQTHFGNRFNMLRQKTVGYRDERIKTLSDMMSGILIVKLYAWEDPFLAQIRSLRNSELDYIWKGNVMKAMNYSFFFSSGSLINAITFTCYWGFGGVLTPAKVFSVLIYLNVIKFSVVFFMPLITQFLSECLVSVKRIEDFMKLTDIQHRDDSTHHLLQESNAVLVMKDASFGWSVPVVKDKMEGGPIEILHKFNLKFLPSSLNFVCGVVGSGKSSFINAILGDMPLFSGQMALRTKKIGYVSQSAWILSGTVKDNILFGLPFDSARFAEVVECCALERDLQLFADGADTFIGERGVTLSGGQRARVALARAIYYDADLYLLDDPLAAVDTKVARHLFERCFQGVLKEKCIILVTHQIQFAKYADNILLLEDGKIIEQGTYETILGSDTTFAQSIKQLAATPNDEVEDRTIVSDIDEESLDTSTKVVGFGNEESARGIVPISTYWKFFKSGSSVLMTIVFISTMLVGQFLAVYADIWLALWSNTAGRDVYFVVGSFILAVCVFAFTIARTLLFFYICLQSTRNTFIDMLTSVFRSPMAFFHKNPSGRIMNRFSKDTNLVDENLPQVFIDFLTCTVVILGILGVIAMSIPYLLLIFPFLAYGLVKLRNYYMLTSRQVKRIESTTRSPIYSCIPSTLEGLSIIRAFGAQERIQQGFIKDQDENTRMFFAFLSSGRWIGFRLDVGVSIMNSVIIFIAVPLRSSLGISPALIGLLLSYLIQMYVHSFNHLGYLPFNGQ
jgi:ATP-binding cassette subfamily C (CFTR/MRP) protein 4